MAEIGGLDDALKHVENRRVAVQAGGNVGVYPKHLARVFDAVYTIEPELLNFTCLKANIVEPNVTIFNAALGESSAKSVSVFNPNPSNNGTFQVAGEGSIPVMRIDDMGLKHCDFIQLDIEGMELLALYGGTKTIERFKPVIMIEDRGYSAFFGKSAENIDEYFSSIGYRMVDKFHHDVLFVPR